MVKEKDKINQRRLVLLKEELSKKFRKFSSKAGNLISVKEEKNLLKEKGEPLVEIIKSQKRIKDKYYVKEEKPQESKTIWNGADNQTFGFSPFGAKAKEGLEWKDGSKRGNSFGESNICPKETVASKKIIHNTSPLVNISSAKPGSPTKSNFADILRSTKLILDFSQEKNLFELKKRKMLKLSKKYKLPSEYIQNRVLKKGKELLSLEKVIIKNEPKKRYTLDIEEEEKIINSGSEP